jgi:hypothetical protein
MKFCISEKYKEPAVAVNAIAHAPNKAFSIFLFKRFPLFHLSLSVYHIMNQSNSK